MDSFHWISYHAVILTTDHFPSLAMKVDVQVFININSYHTVNGERFTGLNFHVSHGFLEYRESFSMNTSACLY